MKLFPEIRKRFADVLAGDYIRTATKEAVNEAVKQIKEAATGIDSDDYLYRPITADKNRDLSSVSYARHLEIVHKLWLQNPLAKQIVRMYKNFTIGGGVKITAKDVRVQEIIDKNFMGGESMFGLMLPRYAEALSLTGELIFKPFINSVDGRMRYAYVDSAMVKDFHTDPEDIQTLESVELLAKSGTGKGETLKVIKFNEKTKKHEGDCFVFRINNLPNGTRGFSDLLALADWLDAYDQFLFLSGERHVILNTILWDVLIEGGTPESIAKYKKDNPTPTGRCARYHNEKVTWKAETPDLKTADTAEMFKILRTQTIGGAGFPLHWFGDGSDANYSTSKEMGWPTFKMLDERQGYFKYIIETLVNYSVSKAVEKRSSLNEAAGKEGVKDKSITIEMPELNLRDTAKGSSSFQQVIQGLVAAKTQGWISDETAVEIICNFAENIGVTLDPKEEWTKAQQSKQDNDSEDYNKLPIEQIKALLAKDKTITPEQLAAFFPGQAKPGQVPPQLQKKQLEVEE
jgi:hypothetical protein